jgi:hypothetical protein
MHGIGSRRRIEQGIRKDPRTAPFKHGGFATAESIAAYARAHPAFAARIGAYRDDIEQLLADRTLLHDLVARLMATVDIASEQAPRVAPGSHRVPALVSVIAIAMGALKKVYDVEAKLRELQPTASPKVLEKIADFVVEVLGEFVPEEQVELAVETIGRRLHPFIGSDGSPRDRVDDQHPTGPLDALGQAHVAGATCGSCTHFRADSSRCEARQLFVRASISACDRFGFVAQSR